MSQSPSAPTVTKTHVIFPLAFNVPAATLVFAQVIVVPFFMGMVESFRHLYTPTGTAGTSPLLQTSILPGWMLKFPSRVFFPVWVQVFATSTEGPATSHLNT